MSKRTLLFLIGAGLIFILVLLAIFLEERAQGIVLGLLFIILFVGGFGGLMLLLNFLNDRYFLRPRNPTHLCQSCYRLYRTPEDQNCEYCLETFGLQKPLFALNDFLQAQSVSDLENRIKELEHELGKARGRNILFIEHDIKNLKRIIRIHQGIEKIHSE